MKEQIVIQSIPIESINVLNPRSRNKRKFNSIVKNISKIGLKRPITVSRRASDDEYDLVCGQGRLEAFIALEETSIPAIVIDVSEEDRLLRSLVENIARRVPATMELVRNIEILRSRNYSASRIAEKIDVHQSYVGGILRLLKYGEQKLLLAVDKGRIPVHVAVQIAASDDVAIQQALTEAYEKKQLTSSELVQARKIIEQRKCDRMSLDGSGGIALNSDSSSKAIVRAYKEESDRQRILVKKAKACETFLTFFISALHRLLQNDEFKTLLEEESLDTLPKCLADRIHD